MNLQLTWYALIGFLLTGYAVLDGFDLGVGVLYPFLGRDERQRSALRSAIGPVWDGNEVWLVATGGVLFAAFPFAYAFAFSGFYLAIMLVLFGLILRAVSLEFRHRDERFARVWDAGFFLGSLLPALLLGCAVGNLIRGVPMEVVGPMRPGAGLDYAGTFLELLNPYALLCGVLGLSMFVLHGASWAALKTKGELHDRAVRTRSLAQIAFVVLVVVTTVATAYVAGDHVSNNLGRVLGWAMLVVLLAGVALSRLAMLRGRDLPAFLGSALSVVGLVGLWGVGNYPALIAADGDRLSGITTALSSSDLTLKVMVLVAGVALPLALLYTAYVYRTFAGRVGGDASQY